MSKHKKIQYTDEPIGRIKVVSDFLPNPDDLAIKEETVKNNTAFNHTLYQLSENDS